VRLSTRFGIGAAAAVLPLLGVIAFSVERMQTLAASNQRLAERTAVGQQVGSGVIARLERLDEYVRKHAISQDAGYARLVRETVAAIQHELVELRQTSLSPRELAILDALERELAHVHDQPIAQSIELASDLQQELRHTADAEAAAASEVRDQAWQTAAAAGLVAVAVSGIAVVLMVRALRARLDELIRGTEAVATGTFTFQLDSERDDELDRAAAAFNGMVGKLGELDRMKADFLSSVSHELRTPLVAMQETTNLLLDEILGPLTPRQRQMLELNTEAGARLARMIGELLELSRLAAGLQVTESERDLVALTRTAVSQLEGLAHEREIQLRSVVALDSLLARCDPDRYVQVVQNLIENALRYTPRGGVVEIQLERQPTRALLRVEDSGPGIPAAERERVFERFFRGGGRSSDGGVGLGLAICREIVEAHGGDVWVEDARLGGAALNVALPLPGEA
jgi:two-component system sensor histidine kinase GlrK